MLTHLAFERRARFVALIPTQVPRLWIGFTYRPGLEAPRLNVCGPGALKYVYQATATRCVNGQGLSELELDVREDCLPVTAVQCAVFL